VTARSTYFAPRVLEQLYGHRWFIDADFRLAGATASAVELLDLSGSGALGIFHLELPLGEPMAPVSELVRWTEITARDVAARMPEGWRLDQSSRRPRSITHLVADGPLAPAMSSRFDDWPPSLQWLWRAASGTAEDDYAPDPEAPPNDAIVRLSADWRAMVLRDGAAFIGLEPGASFHATAAVLVHTIYTDALLLGHAQADAVDRLADELAALPDDMDLGGSLRALDARLISLRNRLWWTDLSSHRIANELVAAVHRQRGVEPLFAQIVADQADWSRMVREDRDRKTGAAIGLVTTLGLPFAVSYAGAAVVANPSVTAFALTTGLASAVSASILLLSPSLRGMLVRGRQSKEGRPDR
jgi:hypothetical protein